MGDQPLNRRTRLIQNRRRLRPVWRRLSPAVILLAVVVESHAADIFWNSSFGGAFNAAANWQGGAVPGASDVAHFGLTTNPLLLQRIYTVDFDVNPINQALKIEDDFVTFDLNGRTYATTLTTGNEIGTVPGRSGRLTITDGRIKPALDSELFIGSAAGASGSLTVTTGGEIGGGSLEVSSVLLVVGHFGPGAMTVDNGGRIEVGSNIIGNATGVTGTATITGTGSRWINSEQLIVGNFGQGTLNITAGGLVDNNIGFVGNNSGSTGTVTVSGTNSQLNHFGSLVVGNSGEGVLNITAAARSKTPTHGSAVKPAAPAL